MSETGDNLPDNTLAERAIAKARLNMEQSIEQAAYALTGADYRRLDASLSGMLGRRAIELHMLMEKLDRSFSPRRLLGRQAVKLERGEITHYPTYLWGNHYPLSTPIILAGGTEKMENEFLAKQGYIFTTSHCGRENRKHRQPAIGIYAAAMEVVTGVTEIEPYAYVVHAYGEETGHPYASVLIRENPPLYIGHADTQDDSRLEEPLHLISAAINCLNGS